MSDNVAGTIHQKHEALLAEHGTEIRALHKGQDEMRGDIKSILYAVQSNGKSGVSNIMTCAGLLATFGIGFMTLVILPMQEDTDKRRLEQDDKNKMQYSINAKIAEDLSNYAINEALSRGKVLGKIEHMEIQVRSLYEKGYNGTR